MERGGKEGDRRRGRKGGGARGDFRGQRCGQAFGPWGRGHKTLGRTHREKRGRSGSRTGRAHKGGPGGVERGGWEGGGRVGAEAGGGQPSSPPRKGDGPLPHKHAAKGRHHIGEAGTKGGGGTRGRQMRGSSFFFIVECQEKFPRVSHTCR